MTPPDPPFSPLSDPLPATLAAAHAYARTRLRAADLDEADRTAAWLVEAATGTTRLDALRRPDAPLAPEQAERLAAWIARRLAGEPVQYVTGEAAFRRLTLHVGPGVLVPRAETEELVDLVLARLDGPAAPRLLDAGTGSGCIALALKDERPGATVHALDVSEAALAIARANAARLGLDVAFVRADLLGDVNQVVAALPDPVGAAYDVLVSNPPYIPDADAVALAPEVRQHEPALALFAGPDPLVFYRALARLARRLVRPGGWVAVETDDAYAHASAACFGEGFLSPTVHRDTFGRWRFVTAQRAG